MYASWVRGEKPRRLMSRIMRVRSSLMRHIHRKSWDRGDFRRADATRTGWTKRLRSESVSGSIYRVSGLVQQHVRPDRWLAFARRGRSTRAVYGTVYRG